MLRLFALGAAENFSLLLPLGLLLGVVLALGRLYHESEMTAARACGYGRGRAWLPAALLALPVAGLSAWLNLEFAPMRPGGVPTCRRSHARRPRLPIAAGRFRSFDGGHTVVYARAADRTGQLEKVFIKQAAGSDVITTVAQRAHREIGADGTSQIITL